MEVEPGPGLLEAGEDVTVADAGAGGSMHRCCGEGGAHIPGYQLGLFDAGETGTMGRKESDFASPSQQFAVYISRRDCVFISARWETEDGILSCSRPLQAHHFSEC